MTFTSTSEPIRHMYNLKNLLLLKYDEKVKNKLNDKFHFYDYRMKLWSYISSIHYYQDKRKWDLSELSYQDLKLDLEAYYEQINYY